MNEERAYPLTGGCARGEARYCMITKPMFVHCCHCRWCRRESGSAFALNAMIEAERAEVLQGAPRVVPTPSESGNGQNIARCPRCQAALWSNYAGAGDKIHFLRIGSLDDPDRLPPRHPYLYRLQAALGGAAGRNAGLRGLLRA